MSYTEIYKFNKDGDAECIGETHNSWRGAMAIWGILEQRYLPPLPKPVWMAQKDYDERGYSRCSAVPFGKGEHPLKPVWDLVNDPRVSKVDKVVLATTFDHAVVMKEDFKELFKIMNAFDGDTSIKQQLEVIKEGIDDETLGIAWNQTSVNGDSWDNFNYDEETDETTPYNIKKQDKHWDVFKELREEKLI